MDWFDIIVTTFGGAIIAGLTWLFTKGAKYLSAKTANQYLAGVVNRLDDVALKVVNDVYQTYVKERKRLSEDGTLSEEDKKMAKQIAIASLKDYLGEKGLTELKFLFTGMDTSKVETVLGSVVEDAVAKQKTFITDFKKN